LFESKENFQENDDINTQTRIDRTYVIVPRVDNIPTLENSQRLGSMFCMFNMVRCTYRYGV